MESNLITNEGMARDVDAEAPDADAAALDVETIASADWQQAHAELVRLARTRAGLDSEEARWLLVALRSGAHRRLGFASFLEYLERIFGYSPRFAQERLRVAEALEVLPAMRQALCDGEVSWSVVRELSRIATAKTEVEWLNATRDRSVREVERLVSGRRPGDSPGDPPDRAARRHVIRLEVAAEAFALFREAMGKLRRDAGGPLDDDGAVLMMARQVLRGPSDAGRAGYQVSMTICEKCRHAEQLGRGEPIPVGPEVVEMAECDAQHIPTLATHVGEPEDATHVGEPEDATHVGEPEDATHVGEPEDATHVGEPANATHVGEPVGRARRARATQAIPPATRRAVIARDAGRCGVPGCRHATWVDLHHIDLKAEGGDHDPDNLICVCGAHHLALHRGDLRIEGRVSSGLTFRHADGTIYGGPVSPHAAEVSSSVFRAMRGLGFKETDARRALERASTHVGPQATAEMLLRAALGETQRQP